MIMGKSDGDNSPSTITDKTDGKAEDDTMWYR